MACHIPPLNKAKKQGEMPLPNLGPVPSLNSTFAHVHNYWSFIECTKKIAAAGVHNYVRAEGKGSNVQRSRKRLKFENVLTVVPLLFLACTRIASLTDYSASKVAKIVVRHKIVSVSVEGYVSQKSSTPEKPKESSFRDWKHPRGLLTWLWSGWINYVVIQHFTKSVAISFLCFTTNGILVLAFSFSSFVESPFTCLYSFVYKLKIVTGPLWECFQILIFCVVVAHSFPFLRSYIIMRFWQQFRPFQSSIPVQ